MTSHADDPKSQAHREFFRDVLRKTHQVIAEKFGLSNISVRPMGSDGSRLSIPVRIEGIDRNGRKVRYFGKIMGSSDLVTARTIQFFKNVYLQMNSMDPLFEVVESAEVMAKHQHDMLLAIDTLGIPTARPLGFYPIRADLWLLVAEFIEARSISSLGTLPLEHLDVIFGYLKRMHKADLFHGDIKPDNLMFGDRIYIVDVGHFAQDVPSAQKKAYDLASQIGSLLEYAPVEEIVKAARRHYPRRDLQKAADYFDLVQRRPDIHFSDDTKERLIRLLRRGGRRRSRKATGP